MKGKNGQPDFSACVLRVLLCCACLAISILNTQFSVFAQDDSLDTAPPPLKLMSREERKKLDAETDLKDRTKLALQLMNIRLGTAERLSSDGNFDAMFRELGVFHALVDDSIAFLEKRSVDNGKLLDTLKRLEIGLRGYIPRLESIRREIPVRYEDYVRKLMKFVREARSRAIDPMFGETVIQTKGA